MADIEPIDHDVVLESLLFTITRDDGALIAPCLEAFQQGLRRVGDILCSMLPRSAVILVRLSEVLPTRRRVVDTHAAQARR